MTRPAAADPSAATVSTLETISLGSKDRRVAYVSTAATPVEAPNWVPDATNTLYFNAGGRLLKVHAEIPRAAPNPTESVAQPVTIGALTRIGHDHVFSPDGRWIALSDQSIIYVAPAAGGEPRRVIDKSPSYVRGWSPDGQTIVYAAERGGNLDVYTVPAAGGAERRLTDAPGRDDGPEFSPDGRYIYFNSDRGGSMQVWRMRPDGSAAEALTTDQANWSPHVSPDGKTLVFLTAARGATDRLDNTDVTLRRMNLSDNTIDVLAAFFGGKGSLNVSSFAPTGQHLAFVSYLRQH